MDGIRYVEACLRQGMGISSKILQLGLDNGEVYAALPEGTSLERATSFDVGGLMSRRDAIAWFAEHVDNLWRIEGTGTLVIQDVWVRSNAPAVQMSTVKKFFNDTEVYYFLEKGDCEWPSINAAIGAVVSFLFIATFSRYPIRSDDLPADGIVTESVVDEIARAAREVFVSAYDQEG